MKRLILLAIVLCGLALSSCEKEPKNEPYYVLFFSAHVVDEAGNPIQGIYSYPEGDEFYGRSGYSDYRGIIDYGFVHSNPNKLYKVVFEDIDGDYNGGEYESVTVDIRNQLTGINNKPDEWGYVGSAVVNVGTITMQHKQ